MKKRTPKQPKQKLPPKTLDEKQLETVAGGKVWCDDWLAPV